MKTFIYGSLFGIVVATIGFSGIIKVADYGVDSTKAVVRSAAESADKAKEEQKVLAPQSAVETPVAVPDAMKVAAAEELEERIRVQEKTAAEIGAEIDKLSAQLDKAIDRESAR